MLEVHGEKLAVMCGLVNTPKGMPPCLAILENCQVTIALASKVEQRTVVCRDTSFFDVLEGKWNLGEYRYNANANLQWFFQMQAFLVYDYMIMLALLHTNFGDKRYSSSS